MNENVLNKLKILAESAKYDVSCSSSGTVRSNKPGMLGNTVGGWGICHSFAEDGRCISLLKVMLTNYCIYDCAYCINRRSNDLPRATLSVSELVDLTMEFYRRNYIEGLFLSSGVVRSPDYTMERLVRVAKDLRTVHRFNGYIHLKSIPGASRELVNEAGLYADRLSVNVEIPKEENLKLLAPEKDHKSVYAPMRYIQQGVLESSDAREKREKGGGVKAQQEPVKEPEPVPVVEEPKATLILRTPIITVMGHVDHGKTSLLDYIRKARVAKGEAGGITQHIGAYTVEYNGSTLTFLDTPGHAIFTEMRARGADVTDIVVLVVAANDGIMPQTREAIAHSKAAGKTIIVAINKCDLPAADPVKTKSGLMEEGLVPTDFGGDVECVEVSALTGDGIDDLLGLLVLQSEVLELQANPKANCRASIIEARVEPGTGSSATAIVESGTIRVGMPFICGPYAGKVRALVNDHGERVKKVGPGMPVEITGFSETPNVGDELVEMENERAAKKLGEERQEELRKQRLAQPRKARMEELLAMMGDGTQKAQLKILLKGDVQGSVEAIKKAIMDIQSDKVECVFLNASAGPISESDVLLASSSDAVILGFNVKVEANAVKLLKREGVQVKLYSIVYELIDQVRDAMLGLLEPETRETIIGHAKVLQVFKLNKGRAAGCMVEDGKILRSCEARVIRDKTPVFDGKMSTLRRFQDEVEEVKAGLECGIRLGDFNEYEAGDIIECYTLEKIQQTL